jgi:hypothetical protein
MGQQGISRVLAGPHCWAGSVAPGCAGQLACQRWDKTEGGERREKVRDLSAKSKNSRGLGEKGAKTHSSQGQIKKHLNTIFPQLFKIYIFSFMTMFI